MADSLKPTILLLLFVTADNFVERDVRMAVTCIRITFTWHSRPLGLQCEGLLRASVDACKAMLTRSGKGHSATCKGEIVSWTYFFASHTLSASILIKFHCILSRHRVLPFTHIVKHRWIHRRTTFFLLRYLNVLFLQ